ncbi:MAG: 5'/3'-nucleotidase SurE [Endomicrobiales bacterium]|nr:5'/3'-nucleotidase SurE [Endomicrobiales bacterium]
MKRILITNDDGIYCPGLKPLITEIRKLGKVVTVVPDQERSGTSHSITLHKPIRLQKCGNNIFTINGTPADCVRYGVISAGKGKIDLVISGVNSGPNMGHDVIYSGTVAGAREGAVYNIPSIAVSVAEASGGNFRLAAAAARKIAQGVLAGGFPENIYLNVNVPKKVDGYRITKLGKRIYDDEIECRTDPRGHKYYWLVGRFVTGIEEPGTDLEAVKKGYVSITPLELDPTAAALNASFTRWIKDLK